MGSGIVYILGGLHHVCGPKLNHLSRSSLGQKQSRLGLPGTIKWHVMNNCIHTSSPNPKRVHRILSWTLNFSRRAHLLPHFVIFLLYKYFTPYLINSKFYPKPFSLAFLLIYLTSTDLNSSNFSKPYPSKVCF